MRKQIQNLLQTNLKSALAVTAINIPLSISLAVASGATPLQGLLTGIWAGVFASIFASSAYNVFGVAGALSSILLTFVITHGEIGIALLPVLAFISGCIIVIISLLRITRYITLIPSTALHGFLIAVGVTIALSQVMGALGLNDPSLHIPTHKEIYMTILELLRNFDKTSIVAFLTFLGGFSFLQVTKRYLPNLPSVILLTLVGIGIGWLASRGYYGDMLLLREQYPALHFSFWNNPWGSLDIDSWGEAWQIIRSILSTAFVIAIIAILETIISAKIAQKITKKSFDKDREVFGLGLANIGSGIFGGLPATAVFIRTALNIKSGATSRLSGFFAAILTLLISVLLFQGFFSYLPFPIISAILMHIAVGLIDIALLKKLYHLERGAFFITLLVTLVSVMVEPTYGILMGIAMTLLIYLGNATKHNANVSIFRGEKLFKKMSLAQYLHNQVEGDLVLVKFTGGLSYLNTEHTLEMIMQLDHHQTVFLSMDHIIQIDIDGVEAIESMIEHLEEHGITVILTGLTPHENHIMKRTHIYTELLHKKRVYSGTTEALAQYNR